MHNSLSAIFQDLFLTTKPKEFEIPNLPEASYLRLLCVCVSSLCVSISGLVLQLHIFHFFMVQVRTELQILMAKAENLPQGHSYDHLPSLNWEGELGGHPWAGVASVNPPQHDASTT